MGIVYVFTKEGVKEIDSLELQCSDYPLGTFAYFAALDIDFPWSSSVASGSEMFRYWNDLTPEEVPAEIRAQLLLVM